MLASNVLLSALAILPYGPADLARSEAEAEQEKERGMRMASLLGFSVVRTPSCPCLLQKHAWIIRQGQSNPMSLLSFSMAEFDSFDILCTPICEYRSRSFC